MYDDLAMLELERREEQDGPGPRLWDGSGACCAAYQLGACDHTESFTEEDYEAMDADWRRDFPEEAAEADRRSEAWLAEQAAREAARGNVEPF